MNDPRNPDLCITQGYDIHVVFEAQQLADSRELYAEFMAYILQNSIPHQRPLVFEQAVGPRPCPMWQVLLPKSPRAYEDLGRCISWFMLNRRGFSVMIHPNTHREHELGGSYEDHSENGLWLGSPLALRLEKLA
jgi:aromatic ring-cleaving dioxygenase